MFAAVVLFVLLLIGILYIAFMRFGNPPEATPTPAAALRLPDAGGETTRVIAATPDAWSFGAHRQPTRHG